MKAYIKMNKKNIWYISKYIPPAYAAKNQARGFLILSELKKKGHNTLLITSDSSHQTNAPIFKGRYYKEQVEGVEVHWVRTLKYKKSTSIGRILSWLDFELQLFRMPKKTLFKPDVVIVSSMSIFTILNGLVLRKKYNCKLIFEVRDIWPLVLICSGNLNKNNIFVKFLAWLEKLAYKKADKVVGTMPNLSARIFDVTHKEITAACVPQVIDPKLLLPPSPLSDQYIKQYIPSGKIIICHAGSIGINNSLDIFLASARALHHRTDIHFLIVGEGDLKPKYQEENKEFSNITFAPRVEKNQVQSVLELTDIVYFSVAKSILWEYGQSLNKVIDYMLSGKPILASFSGYPSMINEAECGVYVPAEDEEALIDAIQQFADLAPAERERMGQRGREWVIKHRNVQAVAQTYLDVIKDLD